MKIITTWQTIAVGKIDSSQRDGYTPTCDDYWVRELAGLSFTALLTSLSSNPLTRGKQFERLIKWWLTQDPIWSRKVKNVWLWDEWPDYPGRDIGIDLVAEMTDGTLCAVQAKCFDENRDIPKSELDSFISAASHRTFHHRLLVATTDGLSANAKRMLADQHVVRVMRSDLESSLDVWPASIEELSAPAQPHASPRPHQKLAITDVTNGFEGNSRGQLIMACGTGKTLTALWIKETLTPQTTLVLVPSLNLLAQTLSEWAKNSLSPWQYLCVCSDDTVNKLDDQPISTVGDLPFEVTTNPADIAKFLSLGGERIIFSTYQSSAQVAKAQEQSGVSFDLVICDEAHRLTGKTDADYATVLDEKKIVGQKRLFMTATPRTYTTAAKTKAEDRGVEITSMDDEHVYGPVLHKLSFGEAIKQNLLSDYRVLIVGVTDPQVQDLIDRRELVSVNDSVNTDARTLAAHIGLAKATKDYNLKRTISFHSRIKSADQFAKDHLKILDWLPDTHKPSGNTWTGTISGAMNTGDRRRLIKQLSLAGNDRHALLTNARCLTEGVDVPSLDGVAFIDPRSSQVDIIQAVGRAIRKSKSKEIGTIVLPVLIPTDSDIEKALEDTSFKPIWAILNALKSHDDDFAVELNNLRTELGRTGKSGDLPDRLIEDLPEDIDSLLPGFSSKLSISILERMSSSWDFRLGCLIAYSEQFGTTQVPDEMTYRGVALGDWVQQQRQEYRKQNLLTSRIQTLEKLPGWSWTVMDKLWNDNFERLLKENEKHPINFISGQPTDSSQLNGWIQTQRGRFAQGKLESQKISLLESLDGWIWNALDARFESMIELVRQFSEKYGNTKFNKDHPEKQFQILASWAVTVRQTYKFGLISEERIARLNKIPGWSWNPLNDRWDEMFNLLLEYSQEFGNATPTAKFIYKDLKLGQWVSLQRQKKNKNLIPLSRIEALETIKGWSWDPINERWDEGYSLTKKFTEVNGRTPPSGCIIKKFSLGSWVNTQRIDYKEGKLTADRISKLESLSGWSWNPSTEKKDDLVQRLKEYEKTNAHCNVSNKEDSNLALFVSRCRSRYKEGSIEKELIGLLEAIPTWGWDTPDQTSEIVVRDIALVDLLKRYTKEFGLPHLTKTQIYMGEPLGLWLINIRQRHVSGTVDKQVLELFDEIPGWHWKSTVVIGSAKETTWRANYQEIQEYVARHGDFVLPYKEQLSNQLKSWVNVQRVLYRERSLSQAKVELLEEITGWTWQPLTDLTPWMKKFSLLKQYLERERVSSIPKKHLEDGVRIHSWAAYQRRLFRQSQLTQTQISLLESIPYWKWTSDNDFSTKPQDG